MTMSQRKMVSETTLKMILGWQVVEEVEVVSYLLVERSSLKKEMATGRMMRLAMSSRSMQMSQ